MTGEGVLEPSIEAMGEAVELDWAMITSRSVMVDSLMAPQTASTEPSRMEPEVRRLEPVFIMLDISRAVVGSIEQCKERWWCLHAAGCGREHMM